MEQKSLFQITVEDTQFSAKHRIGRELSMEELKDVEKYLKNAFEDWGHILRDAVLKITGEKELSQN